MRIPNPIATTTTEAYLAYKAGVLAQADLKEKLYHPYIHIDGWLAYWTGLTDTYPTDKNGDPECLTDEEAYIAYLAGVTSEYPEALKDPADPRMAGYLKYLISARFGRPNYPVTREELYLSMMKPSVVPSGDPSSSIDLEGTIEYPFISMEMYGDTYQQTYSGKNLINPATLESGVISSETGANIENVNRVRISSDGAITVTGGATYTVSTSADLRVALYAYNGSTFITGWGGSWVPVDNMPYTFTTPSNATKLRIAFSFADSRRIYVSDVTNPQLELGSSVTPYEPYVGGIPAPNPSYPQPVQVVTGEQTVTITDGAEESQEYEVNLGKNLFDKDNANTLQGYFNLSNTKIQTLGYNAIVYIPCEPSTTYTVQRARSGFGGSMAVGYTTTLPTVGTQVYSITMSSVVDGIAYSTITTGADAKYLVTRVYHNTQDTLTFSEVLATIQIEKGSTATSYAPYFEPIELCKIGTYQDYIYKSGDDWYLRKAVRHLSLAINDMDNAETYPGWRNQTQLKSDLGTTSGGQIFTDTSMVTNIAGLVTSTSRSVTKNFNGSNATLLLPTDYYGSDHNQTYWKTNYSNLVVDFYYGINGTITDTQITNMALINQLNALMEGGSYDGETHIRVSATDPNLPALLKVEAAK